MDKILIVDDDIAIRESLRFALRDRYELFLANNSKSAMDHYLKEDITLTVLDLKLGNEDGMDIYHKIKRINKEAIVIIITGYGTISSSIEAIKSGIFHYLTKPIDLNQLELLIEKGIEINNLYKKLNDLGEQASGKYEKYGIIAQSKSMKAILSTAEKVKDIDSNVLITGESGTGKGLIAKFIHYDGNRSKGKLNTVNCAAIPSALLESELFGYKKGAFTGALTDKKGYFELSNEGTLFLDEIGDMDISLQGKILRAIQEKTISPLGSEKEVKINLRLITATNKNLSELVEKGEFREDLYYRLNVINLHIPPLREREEDIIYLIDYFVNKYSDLLNKKIEKVDHEFIRILKNYEFKGNIRELENIIERAIALSDNKILTGEDILLHLRKDDIDEEKIDKKLIPVFIGESFEAIERKVIEQTYQACEFNQKRTAKILGITDRTIRNKLKQYKEEDEKY